MEFIYDRSAEDVLQRTKKGVLNQVDLNRIEQNTKSIADKIGITIPAIKTWYLTSIIKVSDFKRIQGSVEKIRGYATMKDTPQTPPQPLNHYVKWNAIERILHDVNELYERNESAKIYCSEITAGEGIGII